MGILKCFYDKIIYNNFLKINSEFQNFLLTEWEPLNDISNTEFYLSIEKDISSQYRIVYKNDLNTNIWKVVQSLRRIILKKDEIKAQFEELLKINANLPAQRSAEWYVFREDMITASNWGNVMGYIGSEIELLKSKLGITKFNGNAATMFGTKYEAVATSIYEKRMNKKMIEFGCLRHPDPNNFFLGASPDGISDDGVMLEIKCPSSREILPIPTSYYWAQMQGQLEICNLERCDFLECKIREYEDEEEYNNDNDNNNESGVILTFKDRNGNLSYIYSSFFIKGDELQKWIIDNIKIKYKDKMDYLGVSYWYLKYYQCMPVFRDREWFAMARVKLKEFYDKWQYYKGLGEDGIRQLKTIKPKKNQIDDKSITEYEGFVIEKNNEEQTLSISKLKKFGFSAISSTSNITDDGNDGNDGNDNNKNVTTIKIKKFGFSKKEVDILPEVREYDGDGDDEDADATTMKIKKFGFSKK